MSEEKKAAALDERALENVSGGAMQFTSPGRPYVCPACDYATTSRQGSIPCPRCGAAMVEIVKP